MRTYVYRCVRSGGWWAISVPEVRGVHAQTRRLDRAEAAAREAVSLVLGVDPASFGLEREVE